MKASTITRLLLVPAVGLGCVAMTACNSNPNRVRWDSIMAPPGNTVIRTFEFQAMKGEQDNFVLYRRYFAMDKVAMPPHGKAKLLDIADMLHYANYPVIVERSLDPDLDEARRRAVEDFLMVMVPPPPPPSEDGLPPIEPPTTTETLKVVVAPSPSMMTMDDETITIQRRASRAGI